MKMNVLVFIVFVSSTIAYALEKEMVVETVYVETTTDTDQDGKWDRLFVTIERPVVDKKLSSIFYISPYSLGLNDVKAYDVNVDLLPQDEDFMKILHMSLEGKSTYKNIESLNKIDKVSLRYARVTADSLGTGKSSGCPTIGDMSETLAAKSVIDWLNGRAKAFYSNGKEANANWANGKVGMTGTSYDGTLPIMVATTGVEGLKAIIPIAAISSWYDYYRANGLVINPEGYPGEDADIMGYYVARKNSCKSVLQTITKTMGRDNGDLTKFWQKRDYVSRAKNIKAATFIIHGQSDWNVKQKHAIQLWEALEGVVPRRMFLHQGGHGSTSRHGLPKKAQDWFDHFLEGDENGITDGAQVEVELADGSLVRQKKWPNEETRIQRFYFGENGTLSTDVGPKSKLSFKDAGRSKKIETLIKNMNEVSDNRLLFLTAPMSKTILISGTSKVSLNLAVMNRKAANITVAIVDYDKDSVGKIITRGWADPQNYQDLNQGEILIPGKNYQVNFNLEPKQYKILKGHRVGIIVASTDFEYTLRPKAGTIIEMNLSKNSFIDLWL